LKKVQLIEAMKSNSEKGYHSLHESVSLNTKRSGEVIRDRASGENVKRNEHSRYASRAILPRPLHTMLQSLRGRPDSMMAATPTTMRMTNTRASSPAPASRVLERRNSAKRIEKGHINAKKQNRENRSKSLILCQFLSKIQ